MSALLALTAAMAGTTFVCEGGDARFSVYAPDQDAIAQSDEAIDLYAFDPLSPVVMEDWTLRMIEDSWPDAISITFKDAGSGEPHLAISPIAEQSGSADFHLAYDATPRSARATPVEIAGSCTLGRSDEKEDA